MFRANLANTLLLAGLLAGPNLTSSKASPVSLDTLVADVVATHPELRHYEAALQAARIGRRGASAWADPVIGIDIGRKRVTGPLGLTDAEGTAWSVSLTQRFEWPGRASLRKAIADHDIALAELGLEQFRATLEARVHELAFGLIAARQQAATTMEVARRIQVLRDVLLARDPAGVTPLLEIRAIESTELVLQRRAMDAALTVNAALVELNQLRGAPLQEDIEFDPVEIQFADAPAPTAILAEASGRNFQLRARLLELERHQSIERLARSQRYPSFEITPFYSEESAIEREQTFGLGVSMPLPISERAGANVETSSAAREQASAAADAEKLAFEREVTLAATAYAALTHEIDRWSPETVSRFREAAQLADDHFREGAVPLATYIALQTAYVDAVDALMQTRRDAIEKGLELELLTGNHLKLVELLP